MSTVNHKALAQAVRKLYPHAAPEITNDIEAGVLDRLGANLTRQLYFLAQTAHESRGFTRFKEDLYYTTPKRLVQVWPSRFKSYEQAAEYVRDPEKLANFVYANRLGNNQPGDGYRYRGRGFQLTGKTNYKVIGDAVGLPLVRDPDLAADPANFFAIAIGYWEYRNLNAAADRKDFKLQTKLLNGGYVGLPERRKALDELTATYSDLARSQGT